MALILRLLPLICLLLQLMKPIAAFQVHHLKCSLLNLDCCHQSRGRIRSSALHDTSGSNDNAPTTITEAQKLMAKAKAIRESIPISATDEPNQQQQTTVNKILSEFSLPQQSLDENSNNYRLYLDIGREKGTWMDPRWGARYVHMVIDYIIFLCISYAHLMIEHTYHTSYAHIFFAQWKTYRMYY